MKKRVLVVDDEVDITMIFKLALEKVNLHVDVYKRYRGGREES